MIIHSSVTVKYKQQTYVLPYFNRVGNRATLLMLHGLGGAKENFWWSTRHPALKAYNLIAFDNPGTGDATYYEDSPLNNDDLLEITKLFIEKMNLNKFFLLGASMGGLTLTQYMQKTGGANVLGLISIEGNLLPEDCMFSATVIQQQYRHFLNKGFQIGISKMKNNPSCGFHIIADNVELNTNPTAYYYFSFQTVEYSYSGELYDAFVQFDCPKLFLHGEVNRDLSYLPKLRQTDVDVKEIAGSDHFLFYDNPLQLYSEIGNFLENHVENG